MRRASTARPKDQFVPRQHDEHERMATCYDTKRADCMAVALVAPGLFGFTLRLPSGPLAVP